MNIRKQGLGRATGKTILMGEHTVAYGEPAIAFPSQATEITAVFTPTKTMQVNCAYFTGLLEDVPQELANIKGVVQQILHFLKEDTFRGTLALTSTIPVEREMGSSAATAMAIVRSLFDYFNYAYTYQGLFELVSLSEKVAHGNPSDIDATATNGADPLFFTKGLPSTHFPMSLSNAYLVVTDTGIKGQARETVKDIAQPAQNNPIAVVETMRQLGSLTKKVR